VVELAPYFDLNIGAEYRFNERFTSFVTLNNLLNSKYPRFLNYPVFGIQLFAGISYSF
jgi:outer membrane receptor protein involved in Fe transport